MASYTLRILVLLCMFVVANVCYAGRTKFSDAAKKVEFMKHLNRVNKPPVKSIKSPDGDIIDCVHIVNQPALDHPLLKNHTIKMNPSYDPNWIKEDTIKVSNASRVGPITQLWHSNGKCPKGTIPIRRTTIDNLLVSVKTIGTDGHNHEHAVVDAEGRFYGIKATINVWNPKVEYDEFSLSQVWIIGGSGSHMNTIEAGWHVYPGFYNGDTNTRLFIFSTQDGYGPSSCYNLLCGGFVQTSHRIAVGGSISPTSQFDGSQFEFILRIWMDPIDGRWWLQIGDEKLGYWPAKFFPSLSEGATRLSWGGEVINDHINGNHTTTQMGSGHFPSQGLKEASYFINIQALDDTTNYRTPKAKDLTPYATEKSCYDIKTGVNDDWGSFFFFGGPGRNEKCQ